MPDRLRACGSVVSKRPIAPSAYSAGALPHGGIPIVAGAQEHINVRSRGARDGTVPAILDAVIHAPRVEILPRLEQRRIAL